MSNENGAERGGYGIHDSPASKYSKSKGRSHGKSHAEGIDYYLNAQMNGGGSGIKGNRFRDMRSGFN